MTGTETTKKFQTKLEDLIFESGKTLRDIEKDTGISRAALNNYANDKAEIGINNIVKLAKYFNVSADYLLGLSESKISADYLLSLKEKNIGDIKDNEKFLQFICDYTGISVKAIDRLRKYCLPDFTYPYDFEPFEEDRILDEEFEIERSKKERKIIDDFILSQAFDELVTHGSRIQNINEAMMSFLAIYFGDYEYFLKLQKEGNGIEDIKLFLAEYENDTIRDAFIDRIDSYNFKFQKSILKYTDELFAFSEYYNSDLSIVFDWIKFVVWKFAKEENSSIDTLRKNIEEHKPEDYIERLSEWKKIYEKLKSR